jgi:glycosyltransferase involved in cell wall biosynthesis
MPSELLSIAIPTRNRSHLLRDLLKSIAAELASSALTPQDVRIYIFDNASTDDTRAVAQEILGGFEHFIYYCNETNIGGDGNILRCAERAPGQYKWLIGDDEFVGVGTLPYLVAHLREHQPGWFIHSGRGFPAAMKPPCTLANVGDFVRLAASEAPGLLITAGTISLNTFRSDCFDIPLARTLVSTCSYAQLFALMNGLHKTGAPVFITERDTIIFREQRPVPPDGGLPLDSDRNWRHCIEWIKETFDVPDLDPEILSRTISRDYLRQILQHPLKTFKNNAAFLRIPKAYPRILKRIWYMIKP